MIVLSDARASRAYTAIIGHIQAKENLLTKAAKPVMVDYAYPMAKDFLCFTFEDRLQAGSTHMSPGLNNPWSTDR
jgi:hypothetical protein